MGQAEPDQAALDGLIVEAALFDSGRPMLVVPYIQRAVSGLIASCFAGMAAAARRALPPTRCRSCDAPSWSKL